MVSEYMKKVSILQVIKEKMKLSKNEIPVLLSDV